MSVKIVVGSYWGDEGKGKCSNKLAKNADIVIRATGGANADYTIVTGGQKYALHLLPSSIVNEKVKSIIAPGVVVDLQVLTEELEMIKKAGIRPNLYVSDRARIVLPTDKEMEEFIERISQNKIRTTKQGINPAYANKAYHFAITMGDLLKPSYMLEDKIKVNAIWGKGISSEQKIRRYIREYRDYLIPYVHNTQEIINEFLDEDRNILIEGSQSMYCDIDHGDGIYNPSGAVTASGLLHGAGIGPIYVESVIGVMKGYCSQEREGPFQTELFDKVGDTIREMGHEYGTTTGKPRRCGWLDLVRARQAVYINGITEWCVNHIDTLGKIGQKFGYIKVATSYMYEDEKINYVPTDSENAVPIYTTFKGGWDTTGCKTYADLPAKARKLIEYIERYTGVAVTYIGIGPADTDVIIHK